MFLSAEGADIFLVEDLLERSCLSLTGVEFFLTGCLLGRRCPSSLGTGSVFLEGFLGRSCLSMISAVELSKKGNQGLYVGVSRNCTKKIEVLDGEKAERVSTGERS